MPTKIAKCAYCGDPIYDFQGYDVEWSPVIPLKDRQYHKGCLKIKKEEE